MNLKNIRCILLFSLIAITNLLVSCTRESFNEIGNKVVAGEPATIELAMSGGTRGLLPLTGILDDDAISSLRIMIFNSASGGSGTLAYNFMLSPSELSDMNNSSIPYKMAITTGNFDFVFIANEDSDTELRGVNTLTQILNAYTVGSNTLSNIMSEYFSSSAFQNGITIPMTAIFRNAKVNINNTVTLSGETSPQTPPWRVEVERAAIRVDLIMKTTEPYSAANLSAFQITNVPNKVYLFSADENNTTLYNVTGSGSFEADSPVLSYRSISGNDGDIFTTDANGDYFEESSSAISFVETPAGSGEYYWYKRIILPSSMFNPASTEANAMLMSAIVSGRSSSATLGDDILGYTADRNNRYRIEGTLKAAQPIEFTVTVTPWGQTNKIPVSPISEPDYFVIDHTFNSTTIHLHMVKVDQPFGVTWYQYANVPENHDSENVPPAGTQNTPPRDFSCTELFSRNPSNPWRLPTNAELWAIRDYVQNNGGDAAFNFTTATGTGFYWAATTPAGIPAQAHMLQMSTTGSGSIPKINSINARCVRNQTAETGLPPGVTFSVSPSPASFAATGAVRTLTVNSNVKWVARVKTDTNVITGGTAALLGQPLISAFDGKSIYELASYGDAGVVTSLPLTITPINYMTPLRLMNGTLVIEFRDATTGQFLKDVNVMILAANNASIPASVSLTGAANGKSFRINDSSGLEWTVTSNDPWVTLSNTNAPGTASLTRVGTGAIDVFAYAEYNSTLVARQGTITFSRPGMDDRTIIVYQAAPTLNLGSVAGVQSFAPITVSMPIGGELIIENPAWLSLAITDNTSGIILDAVLDISNPANLKVDVTLDVSDLEVDLAGYLQVTYHGVATVLSNEAYAVRLSIFEFINNQWFSRLIDVGNYGSVQNGSAQALCPTGSTLARNQTEATIVANAGNVGVGTRNYSTWVGAPVYSPSPLLYYAYTGNTSSPYVYASWGNTTRCIRR